MRIREPESSRVESRRNGSNATAPASLTSKGIHALHQQGRIAASLDHAMGRARARPRALVRASRQCRFLPRPTRSRPALSGGAGRPRHMRRAPERREAPATSLRRRHAGAARLRGSRRVEGEPAGFGTRIYARLRVLTRCDADWPDSCPSAHDSLSRHNATCSRTRPGAVPP